MLPDGVRPSSHGVSCRQVLGCISKGVVPIYHARLLQEVNQLLDTLLSLLLLDLSPLVLRGALCNSSMQT